LIFWTDLTGSQNSSVELSQVMNHGFWSTTPRQNAKVWSGTLQTLPVPRKRESANPKSNRCSFVLFDSQGIVHKEFVPPGQTVNQTFYREVLERFTKMVARVLPGIARPWILHHDNAPCNTAVSINKFLAEKSITVVPQPPYSPDLSPCDFFLFLRLKNHLKGPHFGILNNIQNSVTDELKVIPTEAFQHCYEQ